ncbi:unnamed protein product [Meloidogyne enterolobii]|uniref:Uncharacterized protein n=1 Tax=Meloidogyne enterolobii TaxID=390850 RepID=A0ACB0YFE0_MELEN
MKECPTFLFVGGFLVQFAYVLSINTFYDHNKSRDYIPNVWRRFIVAFLNNFFGIILTYQLIEVVNLFLKFFKIVIRVAVFGRASV